MADLRPFRGWFYDTSKAEASALLAPPYDVIDESERAALATKHEHNSVRAILPEGEGDSKYPEANRLLTEWRDSGVLKQSESPAEP